MGKKTQKRSGNYGNEAVYDGAASKYILSLLHLLIDNSRDFIALLKTDGTVMSINDTAAGSLPDEDAEVIGRYFWNTGWWRGDAEQQEQIREAIHSACRGTPVTLESTPAMTAGRRFYEMSLEPVPDTPGSVELVLVVGRDMTERKDAERVARDSEWLFRAVFNQHFQLMGILTLEGTIVEANTTALKLGGISEAEVKGKPFWETPWWAHSKELQNQLRQAVDRCAKGECVAFEVTHVAADGEIRCLDFSLRPLKDDTGNVRFLIPESRDITEQKRAEIALSEAAAKYRIVADNTYSWEVWMSPEGKYIYCSPSCRRITGHAAEEFMADPQLLSRLVHPDDLEAWSKHRAQAVSSKALKEVEFRLLRHGETVWIHHVCTPIYDDNGIFRGTRGNFEDITTRKLAEEKNLLLATVVESSDDAIFSKTADGIITSWNRGAEKIFGYQEREVVGKDVTMLFPAERKEEVLHLHKRIRRGEHIEHYETVSRKKDGEVFDMSFTYSPIKDEQGRVVAVSSTGRDITARNKAAAALKENERIRRELELHEKELLLLRQNRLAAMGEMIGNIAHQWRQPLNTLGLCAQELCMTYKKGKFSCDYLEESVKRMMETIQYMSKTIDDFRDFTRTDNEKIEFSIQEVIKKTISLQQHTLEAEQIQIEVLGECDLLVTGSPNEFSQVLLNIMMNARHAFLKQKVKNPMVRIELKSEGKNCVVTITDNAGGIQKEIIDKIFDPYFTTKGPEQGTGIGLYMSKIIIERNMGGTLTARNVDGGAEFRIVV